MPYYLENYNNNFADQYDAHLSRFYIKALKIKALDKPVKTLNNILTPYYKKPTKQFIDTVLKEVRVLLTAVSQAKKELNDGVKIPLGSNNFYNSDAAKGQNICHKRFKQVCIAAEKAGLLCVYVGCEKNLEGEPKLSRLIFSQDLLNMIDVEKVKAYIPDQPKEFKPVICKGIETKKELKLPKGFGNGSDVYKFVSDWNTVLSETKIEFKGREIAPPLYQKHVVKDEKSKEVYTVRNYVFGGGIQTQSNKNNERSTIKLNGEATTCLDIKSIHPNILYTKKAWKLSPDFDPYEIEHNYTEHKKPMRDFIKVVFMILLFSGNSGGATRAIKDKLLADINSGKGSYSWLATNEEQAAAVAKKLHKDLVKHNTPIKEFFYNKKLWTELQQTDSEIFDKVISDLISEKIPVLSWHDGIVFPTRVEAKVNTLIYKHWESVLGNIDNLTVKVEFKNTDDQLTTLDNGDQVNTETGEVISAKPVFFKPSLTYRKRNPIIVNHSKRIGEVQQQI